MGGGEGRILGGVEVKGLKPELEVTGIIPGEGSLLIAGSLEAWKLPARSPMLVRIPWPPQGNHTLAGGILKAAITTLPQSYIEKLNSMISDATFKASHTSYNVTILDKEAVKVGEVNASLRKAEVKVYMLQESAPTTTTTKTTTSTRVGSSTSKTPGAATATSTPTPGSTPGKASPTKSPTSQAAQGSATTATGRGGVGRTALAVGAAVVVIVAVVAVALARR